MRKLARILAALTILGFMILSLSAANGQEIEPEINSVDYNTAIGVRAGQTSGLTIKHFTNRNTAWEGILGFWNNGFSATVIREKHVPAFNTRGFNWYYGIGAHAALDAGWDGGYVYPYRNRGDYIYDGYLGLGVDAIAGLEYKIYKLPVAISLDVKPFIEVTTAGNIWMSIDPGLGIKATF